MQLLCSRGSALAEVFFAVPRVAPTGLCKLDRHFYVKLHSHACYMQPLRGLGCSAEKYQHHSATEEGMQCVQGSGGTSGGR